MSPRLNYWWRYWRAWRGRNVGNYESAARAHPTARARPVVRRRRVHVGRRRRVRVAAEAAGAARDLPRSTSSGRRRSSNGKSGNGSRSVEFVLGDVTDPRTLAPSAPSTSSFAPAFSTITPALSNLLAALRSICGQTLILRTSTIPEVDGLPNAAVFFPQLPRSQPRIVAALAPRTSASGRDLEPFKPAVGYGNWFWGLTPSCLRSMLEVAGFRVEQEWLEPFAWTGVCAPVTTPLVHRLPGAAEARELRRRRVGGRRRAARIAGRQLHLLQQVPPGAEG